MAADAWQPKQNSEGVIKHEGDPILTPTVMHAKYVIFRNQLDVSVHADKGAIPSFGFYCRRMHEGLKVVFFFN